MQLPQAYLPTNGRTIGHSDVRALLAIAGQQDNQDFGRLVWLESTDDNDFAVFNPADRPALAVERALPSQPPDALALGPFEVSHGDREAIETKDAALDEDLNDAGSLIRPVAGDSEDQLTSTDTRQLTFLRASLLA